MTELTKKRFLFFPDQNVSNCEFHLPLAAECGGEDERYARILPVYFNLIQSSSNLSNSHYAPGSEPHTQDSEKVKILSSCYLESGKGIRYLTAIIKVIELYFMPQGSLNTVSNCVIESSPQPCMLGVIITYE